MANVKNNANAFTIQDMADFNSAQHGQQIFVIGQSTIGDRSYRSYYYDENSTATPDGDNVVGATGMEGIGRFIKQKVEVTSEMIETALGFSFGTAAESSATDFAMAAQGILADTAVQPAALTSGLAGKQNTLTLTTTGTGPATLNVSTGALNIPTPATLVGTNNASAYGTGTVYTLTTSSAKVAFGTTSPSITIPAAGTYLIMSNVKIEYSGLLTLGATSANLKLRRTNNTATDLSNATTTYNVPAISLTALTQTAGDADIAPVIYTTTNSNDVIEIWGSRGANVSAGSIQIGEASIVAIRLY